MFKSIDQGIAIILGLIALGVLAVWELFGEVVKLVRRKAKRGF